MQAGCGSACLRVAIARTRTRLLTASACLPPPTPSPAPQIMTQLQEHPNIVMDESADANEEKAVAPEEGAPTKVWGNLVAFVERLDDELFKSLQVIDPHTHEYMNRLRDEPVLLALAQKVGGAAGAAHARGTGVCAAARPPSCAAAARLPRWRSAQHLRAPHPGTPAPSPPQVYDYLGRIGDTAAQSKVALRLVEHLYFKHQVGGPGKHGSCWERAAARKVEGPRLGPASPRAAQALEQMSARCSSSPSRPATPLPPPPPPGQGVYDAMRRLALQQQQQQAAEAQAAAAAAATAEAEAERVAAEGNEDEESPADRCAPRAGWDEGACFARARPQHPPPKLRLT
jgi:hypothetical protein